MNELVIMKDQQAVKTSLRVAKAFGKQHKHVIEVIEDKVHLAENSAQLNHRPELGRWFNLTF